MNSLSSLARMSTSSLAFLLSLTHLATLTSPEPRTVARYTVPNPPSPSLLLATSYWLLYIFYLFFGDLLYLVSFP